MYIAGLAQSLASQFTVAKPVNQTYDMTRPFLAPVQLVGTHASLYPLTASRHDGLVEAVKDGEPLRSTTEPFCACSYIIRILK